MINKLLITNFNKFVKSTNHKMASASNYFIFTIYQNYL